MPTRDELRASIAREQALIARLERKREEAQARVRSLHAVLDGPADGAELTLPRTSPPATAAEKVALFRSLFRGRHDVFAKLWVNPARIERATRPPVPTSGCAAFARSRASSAASARIRPSSR